MHSNSMFTLLAALSLAAATPVDYSLQARGNTPSKPADIKCAGEIVGYRSVPVQAKADQINKAKAFPKDNPAGNDLGGKSVYFSDGLGDWPARGTEVNWCIAYADSAQLKAADKVWFPEDPKLKSCTRFSDAKANAYIGMVSKDKFTPESTLRFSKLGDHLQVAIPFDMLDKMKVCGKCFPEAEAKKIKAQFPRINWKAPAYMGSNTKLRRDGLDARAPTTCPLKATPTPKGKPTPTPKGKPASTPKGKKPRADFKP